MPAGLCLRGRYRRACVLAAEWSHTSTNTFTPPCKSLFLQRFLLPNLCEIFCKCLISLEIFHALP